ncbi:MAG: CPBP family intramembrane metalloprotease [Planctomycetes bacterium]|nr:CPBP family intramembrane metalloprotease [Planctomycetota bacterium]
MVEAVLWMFAFYGAQSGAKWLADNAYIDVPAWFPGHGLQNLVMIGGTLILLAYWKLIRKAKLRSIGLRLDRLAGDLKFTVVAAIAMGAFYLLAAGVYWVALRLFFDNPDLAFNSHLRGAVFQEHSWLFYLGVVITMPIVEEVWFRGLLYTPMRKELGRWGAIILLSLLFAAAHNNAFPINQFFGGLIFVWAYEKRQSLIAPILLHILGNGSLVVLGWAFEKWQLV